MVEKIIMDGDWGGDEFQETAVLLSHPDKFKILAATVTFGNTTHDYVLRNCGDILHMLHADDIAYYAGAEKPSDRPTGKGDGAHGANGVGDVILDKANTEPVKNLRSDEYIIEALQNTTEKSITIIATGPLTNLSLAIKRSPEIMKRVKRILIMGGCTEEMPAADMPFRKGNIESDSEFNFNQAPHDAHVVLNSGLPITLFPMNCTHQLTVTSKRQDLIREAFATQPDLMQKILGMMTAPAALDYAKFGIPPVMHDVHTALYLVHPDQYEGRNGVVQIKENGRSDFIEDPNGHITVMEHIKDPDFLFKTVLDSLIQRIQL